MKKNSSDHPIVNHEEVIETLTNENRQYIKTIDEVKNILYSSAEFEGLSLIGGLNVLMKNYIESKTKIYSLEEKIRKLDK